MQILRMLKEFCFQSYDFQQPTCTSFVGLFIAQFAQLLCGISRLINLKRTTLKQYKRGHNESYLVAHVTCFICCWTGGPIDKHRDLLSHNFFKCILPSTSCLHNLLPLPRETCITQCSKNPGTNSLSFSDVSTGQVNNTG